MNKTRNKKPRRDDAELGDIRRMRTPRRPSAKLKYRHMSHWLEELDDLDTELRRSTSISEEE